MTINKNSTEQINVALLDLENKIKRNNQTAAISALSNDIEIINKTLKEKQNGLVAGETYNINISGNAATSNHSLTADNATTADSANTATSAGFATNADHADHANTSDYATSAGSADSAPMIFPEGYVYMQLYRTPSPAQMNMKVPAGCAWVDISKQYSGDYFRVKGTRWHNQMATVNVKVVAYDASTRVVTIESGVIVDGCVWNRDVVRNNNTGDCAWALSRTSETINGVSYNKTYTLDRDIFLTVGQYISLSHGDATQAHVHSGTTSESGNHQHVSNVGVALSNALGSNAWCLTPRNKQYDGGLSGISSWAGNHTHTITTGGIQAIGSDLSQTINSREETRVQCTFMTVWQVQQIQ